MKSFLAYAFIANEFDRGHDPLEILAALIERSLIKGNFTGYFHLPVVQAHVYRDWGFLVPIIILEKHLYALKNIGIVEIIKDSNSGRKKYSVIANPAAEKSVDDNELAAYEKYGRVIAAIEAVRLDAGIETSSEDLLSTWLDSNPSGVLDGTSVSSANRELKTASGIIAKAMGLDSKRNSAFIDDLTDLVVGDHLYLAIHETTQLQSDLSYDESANAFPKRMSDVDLFLDVGVLARLRGHYGSEMKTASIELLDMARALGAGVKTFSHTVEELKGGMEGALNRIKYFPSEAYGPFPAYMLENSRTLSELSEEIDATDIDITALGIEIVNSPEVEEELGLDELEFDRVLLQDVGLENPTARKRDIASLRSVYILRRGLPHRFLERCKAIYVTHNWALQSASHRFFKPYFEDKSPVNTVQICFAEAVIATRLWTKLPSKLAEKPRSQVISYTLANLVPDRIVKERFLESISRFVRDQHISDELAIRLRASRLLDRAIAVRFTRNDEVTEGQIAQVLTEIIKKDKESKLQERKQVAKHAAIIIKKGLEDSYRKDQLRYIEENTSLRQQVDKFEKELIAEKSHSLAIREVANGVAKTLTNLLTVAGVTILIIGGLSLFGYHFGLFVNLLVFLVVVGTGFLTLRGLGIQVLETKVERLVESYFRED